LKIVTSRSAQTWRPGLRRTIPLFVDKTTFGMPKNQRAFARHSIASGHLKLRRISQRS
jgi:hypothetical protein